MDQPDLKWQVTSLLYVVVLLVAGIIGAVLRLSLDNPSRKKLSGVFTTLAIHVLLPFHVFLSLIGAKTSEQLSYYLPLVIAGAICCFSILAFTHFIAKAPQFRSHYDPHFKYVASTMGGGGRAVVLLAGVMPLVETIFPTGLLKQGLMLDVFAIFDFGYWIFFTTIVFNMLMPMSFPQSGAGVTGKLPKLREWGVGIAAALGIVMQYLDWAITATVGHEVSIFLRFILTICIVGLSTVGVVLNVGGSNLLEVSRDMRFIFIARMVGLALPMIVLPLTLVYSYGLSPLFGLIPVLLMLFLPPSSLVGQMLEDKGARPDQVQAIANINMAWNVLLVIVVLFSLATYSAVRWLAG